MQIKYRIPASEIYRMSLSPYFDDIAVIHIRAVSITIYYPRKTTMLDYPDIRIGRLIMAHVPQNHPKCTGLIGLNVGCDL